MKKRSRASGKPAEPRRHKAPTPKRRNASEVARRSSSAADQETEVARLTRERDEALEQQAATADVLKVISRSTFDLQAVLDTLVESAARVCDADGAVIFRREGESYRGAASHGFSDQYDEFIKEQRLTPGRGTVVGRVALEGQTVHIPDVLADPEYTWSEAIKRAGYRTLLGVPLLREGTLIGVMAIHRFAAQPFTDKEIELLTTFADQAVIAIENVRLFEAEQKRTRELTESLEQQTATSEVLQVVSSSPGDLEPVFAAMLENAVRICDATFGNIDRWDGEVLHMLAAHNTPPAFAEARRHLPFRHLPSRPTSHTRHMVETKTVAHVADLAASEDYIERNPRAVAAVELGGVRTFLAVPMLKENEMIGSFSLYRQEVRPFTDKQIELVTNFAAQAVIAIENARLLNELREALGQQTATSEVLQVISSSPSELDRVFQAMLEKATDLCEASFGILALSENGAFRTAAMHNPPSAFAELRRRDPTINAGPQTSLGRVAATKEVVHIPNYAEGMAYEQRDPGAVEMVELAGVRTVLAVPMLKERELIGVIVIYRQEVRPFTGKQIALVANFAAQAVIAIENARLLNELRQSLEQQTATANVLEVISRSAFDLHAVFKTVAESSVRLCGADRAFIFRFDGETLRMAVAFNSSPEFEEWVARHPIRPGRHSGSARAALERRTIHIADVLADPEYVYGAKDVEPIRTVLGVPILKGDELLGVMMIYHLEVRPFTDQQIALVETFADQAAIAIENVRLLEELRKRTEEVEKLNQQLEHRVADQVGEIERMGRLRRFLPPQVADLIVATGTEKQLESHRREITALFCDLRGFTGFSESSDPEDVMALLRDYHAAIGEIIIKYSGTLERYAGDGVMVVFNDPVPVEKPALQAVLMALEMREVIGALTEKWLRLGHDIGFGIGIAHGFATLGTIGFEGRFDYAAIGTVSNVASRLCDEAKPGQILISPRVLMAVEDAVTVEPVGEFTLKGIRRPLAAHNVLAAVSAAA
jgi:GAF domain-containing protein